MFIIKNVGKDGHVCYLTNAKADRGGHGNDWSPYKEDAHRFRLEPRELAARLDNELTGQTYAGDENLLS